MENDEVLPLGARRELPAYERHEQAVDEDLGKVRMCALLASEPQLSPQRIAVQFARAEVRLVDPPGAHEVDPTHTGGRRGLQDPDEDFGAGQREHEIDLRRRRWR